MQAAISRFCITERIRRPKGVRVSKSQVPRTIMTANPITNTRLYPKLTSWMLKCPSSHDGESTSTLFEPKTIRKHCCMKSDTPQVARSDSNGRR